MSVITSSSFERWHVEMLLDVWQIALHCKRCLDDLPRRHSRRVYVDRGSEPLVASSDDLFHFQNLLMKFLDLGRVGNDSRLNCFSDGLYGDDRRSFRRGDNLFGHFVGRCHKNLLRICGY